MPHVARETFFAADDLAVEKGAVLEDDHPAIAGREEMFDHYLDSTPKARRGRRGGKTTDGDPAGDSDELEKDGDS